MKKYAAGDYAVLGNQFAVSITLSPVKSFHHRCHYYLIR